MKKHIGWLMAGVGLLASSAMAEPGSHELSLGLIVFAEAVPPGRLRGFGPFACGRTGIPLFEKVQRKLHLVRTWLSIQRQPIQCLNLLSRRALRRHFRAARQVPGLLGGERTIHQEEGLLRHGGEMALRGVLVGIGKVEGP